MGNKQHVMAVIGWKRCLAVGIFLCFYSVLALGVVGPPQTFTSSVGVSVTGNGSINPPVAAAVTKGSPYPSTLTVSGVSGTISTLSLQLVGLSALSNNFASSTQNLCILLKSPSGRILEVMANSSWGLDTLSNVTLTIDDNAASLMPDPNTAWPSTTGAMTFKPTAYNFANFSESYPNPGPGTLTAGTNQMAPPRGTGTLGGVFGGDSPNGIWSLFLIDNYGTVFDAISITGWSLIITPNATQTATTTTMISTPNPSFNSGAGSVVTFTAAVSGSPAPTGGTVAFQDNGNTMSGCGTVTLSSSGNAVCAITLTAEGDHSITASYSGSGSSAGSTSSILHQIVENQAVPGSAPNSFCNSGRINIPGAGNTSPYPSVINVSGIQSAVSTVEVSLVNFSFGATAHAVRILLVSPDNHALEIFSAGVGATGGLYGLTDSAAGILLDSALSPGTYQPTVYTQNDLFPQPNPPAPQVPGNFVVARPAGGANAATFQSAFANSVSNGPWSLFVADASGVGSAGAMAGGWCLTLHPAIGSPSKTVLNSSKNPALVGDDVTVSASILDANTNQAAPQSGSVQFTENGQPVNGASGPVAVDANGKASFTTASLPEGDHPILGTFNDPNNNFASSFGKVVQRIDGPTTSQLSGVNQSYCNAGHITIPGPSNATNQGAASPNPSNIQVSGAPGTINKVTLSLNNFQHTNARDVYALLVGPKDTGQDSLDFMSAAGGPGATSGAINLTFDDAAATQLPQGSTLTSGTFKPTSYDSTGTFTPNLSGIYTLPSPPYNHASITGAATLASTFANQDPNGNWSLYLNQKLQGAGGGMDGWCLNFTLNAPDLSVALSHSGDFIQGQTGATYTALVTNHGPGASGGTVTLTDVAVAGLTTVAMAGNGWDCQSTAGSCKRNDPLVANSSYDPVSLTVSVANNATSVLKSVQISGGGDASTGNDTATDGTNIIAAPDLTVIKAHVGNFQRGQSGSYTLAVKNIGQAASSGQVTVTDTLPQGLLLQSFIAPGWTCSLSPFSCSRSDALGAGQTYDQITLAVSVATDAPISLTNTAQVAGGGDVNAGNNSAADPTTILAAPDLTISKSHTGNFAQGQAGSYSLVVTNTGPTASSGTVTVTDTLPTGMAPASFAATNWICNLSPFICTRSDGLAVNQSYEPITLTVDVAGNASASLVNTATVVGGGDLSPGNNTASDPTTVTPQTFFLTVNRTGVGTVTSNPAGIDCGATCSASYDNGTAVSLTATTDIHNTFSGWSGDCSGAAACTVTLDSAKTVVAKFDPIPRKLTVATAGTGAGTINSSPAGIDCGASCSANFNSGQTVTLTATPTAGSVFTGWSGGGCTGTGSCVTTLSADTTVTATFALQTVNLTVATAGNGSGTVTSNPVGVSCGSNCQSYNFGQSVTLTANPVAGSTFAGWIGGGCSGTGSCVVALQSATSVTATFALQTVNLTVATTGNGSGMVTSNPAGASCGSNCQSYNFGQSVTLTATPATGSSFAGWSGGGCSGSGECVTTLSANTTVAANFTLQPVNLTVTTTGNGTGTVATNPVGASCGSNCQTYNFGQSVTLTATPAVGSAFTGWSGGGCSGTGDCVTTLSANTSVAANFTLQPVNLTLATTGNGSGTVATNPPGISCGSNCQTYNFGQSVTLTAASAAGTTFTGWSGGGCSGTGECVTTLSANTTVAANFTLQPVNLTLATTGSGSGTVASNPVGVSCGTNCQTYSFGQSVTLTATPATGSTFAGWSGGGCSGTGDCVTTLSANTTVSANFTLQPVNLTLAITGNGSGTVASNPVGVSCGSNCQTYNFGQSVTLTATPAVGSSFTGWSGGGCSTINPCITTLTANATVTVAFTAQGVPTLSVAPPQLAFGHVRPNRAVVLPVTLSNAGTADLQIASIGPASAPFAVVGDRCTQKTLKANQSCSFGVRFKPQAPGLVQASLPIVSNDPASPYSLALSGTGSAAIENPVISSLLPNPPSYGIGEEITILGAGFSANPGTVRIGPKSARLLQWTDTAIVIRVPRLAAGSYPLTVTANGRSVTATDSVMINAPTLDPPASPSGAPRSTVTLTGQFLGTAKPHVVFVSKPNPARKAGAMVLDGNTATEVSFLVPGSLTAGDYFIKVSDAAGSDSVEFTVTPR